MTNLNDAQKEEIASLLQLVARGVKVISKEQQELAWEYIPMFDNKHPKTCVCTGACAQWAKENAVPIPCHVCGIFVSKEELDENAAYTYPDNKPYCPSHQPTE